MVKDLIANAAILVSFLYVGGEVAKFARMRHIDKNITKLLAVILSSLLGSILLVFGVTISSEIIIDLRHFALIIIAINGGFLSTMFSGVLISLFRVFYFGISKGSLNGAILIIVISLLCGLISKIKTKESYKWILMNFVSILSFSFLIITTVKERKVIIDVLVYFTIISIVVGFIIFYFSKHIKLMNSLYFKYKKESTKDFLTGLNNVRKFDLSISSLTSNENLEQMTISFLMLDIDHFKKINDTYGHLVGDEVLKELAGVITRCCRSSDNVSRVGGEEFSVILSDCSSEMAIEIAENIRKAVENNRFTLHQIAMTISIGIAVFPETIDSFDDIRKEADKALYYSKQNGRNQVNLNTACI